LICLGGLTVHVRTGAELERAFQVGTCRRRGGFPVRLSSVARVRAPAGPDSAGRRASGLLLSPHKLLRRPPHLKKTRVVHRGRIIPHSARWSSPLTVWSGADPAVSLPLLLRLLP